MPSAELSFLQNSPISLSALLGGWKKPSYKEVFRFQNIFFSSSNFLICEISQPGQISSPSPLRLHIRPALVKKKKHLKVKSYILQGYPTKAPLLPPPPPLPGLNRTSYLQVSVKV